MPDGVLQWFDPKSGEAAVVRARHVFAANVSDIEPEARHAGARVHFDISHEDPGARAVNVALREGTRVGAGHGNFGTLVGAHRPDTKGAAPFAHAHPELTRELASHPLAVVRMWLERVQSGDLDTALSLYKPDAVVHTASGKVSGHAHLQAMLEASGLMETRSVPDLRGEDDDVVAVWPRTADAAPIREIRSRIAHGTIVEQWIASKAAAPTAEPGAVSPEVVVQGEVDPALVELAKQRLAAMIDQIAEPVLFARVNLSVARDPARTRPALAKATLDVNGDMVRAHVAADELRDAVDRLQYRLRDKLEQRAQHRRADFHRHDTAEPGEWHHGDLTPVRPDFFDRPAEQRQLVRHKVRVLDELTPDEVAFDMDQLDHDFELFRDLASGEDAVLERVPGEGYRLTRLHAADVDLAPTAIALTVAENPPPRVSVSDAIALLDETHEPFVFFEEPTTGHGDVVYRRYDGHYGLITTS